MAARLNTLQHTMGYDLHITRQQGWFDEDETKQITLQEWLDLVATDPDMRLDNYAEATTTDEKATIRVESEGLSVWTKYSGNGVRGNYAWFYYSRGNIVCKNPDDEILDKMLEIAEQLQAKVQGDESEIYDRSADGTITCKHLTDSHSKQPGDKKPWWKFW